MMHYYPGHPYYDGHSRGLPRRTGTLINRELPKDGNRSWKVTTQPLIEPVTIDEIVGALGAESIPYDLKLECCGNPVEKSDKDLSLLMIDNKFKAIQDSGANCVGLVCPACYQQFEFNQRELNKKNNSDYKFPVFYLSELVALAFGFKPAELGFNFHRVRPKALFESIEFVI